MKEILIACGEVDLLRKIAADLPPNTFKPIATRTGQGMAQKLTGRDLALAVVHEALADQGAEDLCAQLRGLPQPPPILWLYHEKAPRGAYFDRALKYPIAGPVFRNALAQLERSDTADADLERWRAFYRELKSRLVQAKLQNYFQMMGLQPGAPHHQLVQAYDVLTQRYHPDRYRQFRDKKWGKAVHEAASELFKLITEAYQVLSDRQLRARYERALQSGELRLDLSAPLAAQRAPRALTDLGESAASKKFLRLAQRDLAAKNLQSALQNLNFARSMEPENAAINEKIAEIQAQLQP